MLASQKVLIGTIGVLLLSGVIAATAFSWPESPEIRADESKASEIKEYILGLDPDDYDMYVHPEYGFSFQYPTDFIVSAWKEENSDIVVAEHPNLDLGFQVVVQPSDEEGPLTEERILQDNPTLTMENPWKFQLMDGTHALRFSSNDPTGRDMRGLWFIREGEFYQVSMYSANKEWLDAWIRKFAGDLVFEEI